MEEGPSPKRYVDGIQNLQTHTGGVPITPRQCTVAFQTYVDLLSSADQQRRFLPQVRRLPADMPADPEASSRLYIKHPSILPLT
jgi:hypothetical protein